MKPITVLSLFNGISVGRVALENINIPVKSYYSSEIDVYANKISQTNYNDIIQIGDVKNVSYKDGVLSTEKGSFEIGNVDLLLAGFNCQSFSFAGKQNGFDDERGKLFFELVRLMEEVKPKYFLLENVVMKKEFETVINDMIGVSPIMINSNLVSAQNRKRLYWTNIPNVTIPTDKYIFFGDIKEYDANKCYYYSEAAFDWIRRHEIRKNKKLKIWADTDKVQMLEATMAKKYSSQRFFGIEDVNGIRYITPLECERAQTLPDGYTSSVSNTQRYKTLGNGWTTDVISHILKNIKEE